MADSHPVQVGTAPCTSPHHILPLLPFPLWILTLSFALLSQPCPSISLCTLLVPLCTVQPILPCHEFSPCFHFHPPYPQTSYLSPQHFSSPHVNAGFAFFGTPVPKYTFSPTRYQFIIGYKYRTKAHYSTKHASSGRFPAYKILISSKLYTPVGKVQHPIGNPTWLLSISFFFPACAKLHYVKIYRALQYFHINLPEES